METQLNVNAICRACGAPHYGEKFDLLQSPTLSDLYILLSGTQFHQDDSLPKQLCTACYLRLEDFNRFQEMCATSYKSFVDRGSKYVISTEAESFEIIIQNERILQPNEIIATQIEEPQFLTSDLASDLARDEIDFYNNLAMLEPEVITTEQSTIGIGDQQVIINNTDNDVDIKHVNVLRAITNQSTEKNRKTRPIGCGLCKKKFWTKENYETHYANHNKQKPGRDPGLTQPYACDKCPIKFWQKERYDVHVVKHDALICKECNNQKFKSKKILENHRLKKHNIPLPSKGIKIKTEKKTKSGGGASKANKKTEVKSTNDNIILLKHNIVIKSECQYECDVCHLRFRIPGTLKAHKKRHKAKKRFQCKHCGITKTTEYLLKIHMKIHNPEESFQCDICQNVYSHKGNLRRHVRVIHEGIKAFKCPVCGNSFAENADLRKHLTRTKCSQAQNQIC